MNDSLKISVITVVRNGLPFVEQTLQSVTSQTYPHIEYIVIDGASTDGTVDVIRQYEHGISKWISEPDAGIADAFNKGLRLATGDYMLFLNADDVLVDSSVVASVVKQIEGAGFPAIAYGDCNVVKRDSAEIKYRANIAYSKATIKRGQMLPHPALFASRQYFRKYGEFDPAYRIAMDYEWLLRGGLQEKVVHLPLLVTQVRDGGMSTRDQRQAIEEIIAALEKNRVLKYAWQARLLRGYYFARRLIKSMLGYAKLHNAYSRLRKRSELSQ